MQDLLRERLTAFRAAYYRLQILRGFLLTGLGTGALFLVFSLLEGVFWWSVPVRQGLWGVWLAVAAFILGKWVGYPILQYGLRLRGYLSDEEAARWIGRRLPEVRDKLLNALQLSQEADRALQAAVLLAIEERMRQLSLLRWEVTLPYPQLRRTAYLLLGLIGVGLLLWWASPQVFRQGTHRFLHPSTPFTPPLPYEIQVEGLKPFYRAGETLQLTFRLKGRTLPAALHAYEGSHLLPLERKSLTQYTLTLPVLRRSFSLRLEAEGQIVGEYLVAVQQPPLLRALAFICRYPSYTGLGTDTLYQSTLRLLRGTQIQMKVLVESSRPYQLWLEAGGRTQPLQKTPNGWVYQWTCVQTTSYQLHLRDAFFHDSLNIQVEALPDHFPSVQLFSEWFNPQTWEQGLKLRLMDDFGFSRAVLWYRIAESPTPGRTEETFRSYPLPIGGAAIQEPSFHLSWATMGVQSGDKVEYYVEAWDNDQVTGPKASRSVIYTLEPASEATKQEVFAQLQDSLFQELERLRHELKGLLEQKSLLRSGRHAVELSERFRSLRSELRSLHRLAQDQQLYTPELLRQIERLQKLLESIEPQKPEQLLSQVQAASSDSAKVEELKRELERAYRQWEEKLQRFSDLLPEYQQARALEQLMTLLSELTEQERQLSQLHDSLQWRPSSRKLQERIADETQGIQRELESWGKQAMSAKLRDSLQGALKHLQEAKQSMREALERMQRQESGAQPAQQRATEALERALNAMDEGLQGALTAEEAEDYEALRYLLKATLTLSFRQENARKKTQESAPFVPLANTLIAEQEGLSKDYKQVRDSLFALAGRSPVVEEAILDLLRDMDRYFQGLSFAQVEPLLRRQQYILQGLNRLANFLTELLAQLEEEQAQRMQGASAGQQSFRVRRKCKGGACMAQSRTQGERPGAQPSRRANASPGALHQLQQQLNEALERALTPNPASESPGGLSPEERARLSAQQELIRLRLQEMLKQSPGDIGALQSLIEEMQRAEKDLLIGAITRERLMRQQAILTRLLEYERSQQERELEPVRESRTAQQFFQRTTGLYPRPNLEPLPAAPKPAFWLYRPPYQNLIEYYFRQR
ncbi:MAG: hypothetical protein NZ958_00995 [Bacteroidia bacterium]|nr:hypothetical protein [Bacteroidia bacterium]MDW8089239.1 hypothetical protein [Bacteroidia bacterium]